MEEKQNSFMDPKTLLAIVVVVVILFGWQKYLQKKYPQPVNKPVAAESNEESVKVADTSNEPEAIKPSLPKTPAPTVKIPEQEVLKEYEDSNISAEISSKGMGIRKIVLKNFTDRDGRLVEFGSSNSTFLLQTRVFGNSMPLDFEITKEKESLFTGKAKFGTAQILKTIEINPNNYTMNVRVEVTNADAQFRGLTTTLAQKFVEAEKSSFFAPSLERQGYFIAHGNSTDTEYTEDDKPVIEKYDKVSILTIGTLYFLAGIIDKSKVFPEASTDFDPSQRLVLANLDHTITAGSDSLVTEFTAFIGPKDYELLHSIDTALVGAVDYGWFRWLGKPLLALMKYLYSVFGNWGVAIILMTLLVRLVVMPFNLMSYKSMKAMQVIQPEIQAVREKYKDDPQTMNQEVMNIMKQNNANPVGGCLPILLQLPVFIALYRVLSQSIELYQAPFILWITDLSLKDQYYVLPILMGITMFIQQKITPTTADPTQKKIFMFMPILFTFIMASLPSGLTLYIFVSTLIGIIQQMFFMRDKSASKKTAPAAV
jgi:YidC/Oxa1 family membrane protein insertase